MFVYFHVIETNSKIILHDITFLTLKCFILLELSWLSFPSLLKDLCLNNPHLLKHTLCLVWLKWPCGSGEENVKTILKRKQK